MKWFRSGDIKKTITRLLLGLIVLLILLLLIILPQDVDPNQNLDKVRFVDFPDTLAHKRFNWDSLGLLVGANKSFPEAYKNSALLALSAYPELWHTPVKFVLTEGGAPMETNFEWPTLISSKEQRVYEIRLNDSPNSIFEGILMRDLPFDAQVGILAHELGHVSYYKEMSSLALAKWGIMYLVSLDFRASHEKTTDLMPIHRGLGSQMYQYAWFVRHSDRNKDMYLQWGSFMDKFYLTDTEILFEIRKVEGIN